MVGWELLFRVNGRTKVLYPALFTQPLAGGRRATTISLDGNGTANSNSTLPVLLKSSIEGFQALSDGALLGILVTIGTLLLVVTLAAFGKRCHSKKRREHWLPCHNKVRAEDQSMTRRLSVIQMHRLLKVYNSVRLDAGTRYSARSKTDETKQDEENNNTIPASVYI